jgi:hypothetical protein
MLQQRIVLYNRDDKMERNPTAIIHETSRYASLARLVADLAEQWLEEEEARVTGFTPVSRAGHRVDIEPAKKLCPSRETRRTPDVTIRESRNRLVGRSSDESLRCFCVGESRRNWSLRTLESGTQSFRETFLFHES